MPQDVRLFLLSLSKIEKHKQEVAEAKARQKAFSQKAAGDAKEKLKKVTAKEKDVRLWVTSLSCQKTRSHNKM